MALLRSGLGLAALAALAACYDPSVRDCVVSCTGAGQCAADQVCGADGWCAAPTVAGRCTTIDAANGDSASADAANPDAASPDAAVDGPSPIDAALPIDAAGPVLRLVISGRGKIVSDQPGVQCTDALGDCSFPIAANTSVVLSAVNTHPNFQFVDWSTPNCQGQGSSCTLTVGSAVTLVTATFE